ncbi:MAG: hypothetical protein QXM31_03005 [Candidatus Woesearchaeota archaeon]
MSNLKSDSEFALALLGIFSILIIVGTILFISQKLGIQTYNVLEPGSPCAKIYCPGQRYPSQEIGRDWARGMAYCQCNDGSIRHARLFS